MRSTSLFIGNTRYARYARPWRLTPLALALGLGLPSLAPAVAHAQDTSTLSPVVVTGTRLDKSLPRQRVFETDTARLLTGHPGVSLYEAGGLSALPVLRGLADDRIRVQVDGMDLVASCPNHMNSPLSYLDASQVARVRVYAGIAPVSVGGDSIAGTLQVESAAPRFVAEGAPGEAGGTLAGYWRSNGQARGLNLRSEWAGPDMALSLSAAGSRAGDYHAGSDFKAAGPAALGRGWLDGDEVGSSAWHSRNADASVAVRADAHLLQLQLGLQDLPYELYPNQRMDMTGNRSTQLKARYSGQYGWGQLQARVYQQRVRHRMDMGPDRYDYGTGMPMDTRSRTDGAGMQADIDLDDQQQLRVGAEGQWYWLYDWWAPVGTGMMAPSTFWNIDDGTRRRAGLFAEWERRWGRATTLVLGLRHDRVSADAGPVQGYNADAIWADDAAAFNARERRRQTRHWDWSALLSTEPDAGLALEAGLARKTRSPSLYERYPWSTQPMAALMNNFVGDGNGYVGNPDLRPEVAHTLSLSADWHDADKAAWNLKLTGHVTRVHDFVDAVRCTAAMCGGATNAAATTGFVNLGYANQSARLWGLDLSGARLLGRSEAWGRWDLSAQASLLRGTNTTTGDSLYHQMPPHLKLALTERLGPWTHAAEYQAVAAKTRVSQVRNEVATPGYALLTLRTSHERGPLRVDVAVDNVFDRGYALPLGGAYAGQGASMSSTSLPWGVTVPGRGRSLDLALSYQY